MEENFNQGFLTELGYVTRFITIFYQLFVGWVKRSETQRSYSQKALSWVSLPQPNLQLDSRLG
jgi:hypothetical protein